MCCKFNRANCLINKKPVDIIKNRCHARMWTAIKSGKLIKQPCSICGSVDNINAHHKDYSKPLDVIWYCSTCHKNYHASTNNPYLL